MADCEHPSPDLLGRFMRGEASRGEARAVVRHLLTRCPQCLQVTHKLWRLGDRAPLKIKPRRAPALEHGDADLAI